MTEVRRCWCGRSIPPDSISTCGCCCTEHDDVPKPDPQTVPSNT